MTPPGAVMPLTAPKSSVKLVTVNGFVAALVRDKLPVDCNAAISLNTFAEFNVILPAPRSNNFALLALRSMTPLCVIVPPDANVKIPPDANVATGDHALIVMFPALLSPIRILLARIVSNSLSFSASVPDPPPNPMVVPLGPVKITVDAFPIPVAVPPI